MKAIRAAASTTDLLDPGHQAWNNAPAETMRLETPPIGNVPSNYFRAMDPTRIGAVKQLEARVLHNGEALLFRLHWEDPEPDQDQDEPGRFRDGAGILFPFGPTARINNMGSRKQPVNAWCWQAGKEKPLNVTAAGLGTTRREKNSYFVVNPNWSDGAWTVVLGRTFQTPEPDLNVALAPGVTKLVGFAVWEGSNHERAGAKSFSVDWRELEIQP